MDHTSAGRGVNGTDLVDWCVPSSRYISSLRGLSPKGLTPLRGVRFIARRLRRLVLRECRPGPRHLSECRARLSYSPAPRTTFKKALCHTRPVGGTADKYRWFQSTVSSRWITLRPAVVSAARIWSSVSRLWTYFEPQGDVPPLLDPPLGECRQYLKYFWSFRVHLGYGSAPRSTLKKALCHPRPFVGTVNKYYWFNELGPVDGSHFGRPAVVSAARIWSSVSRLLTYLEPLGAVHQALTLLGGARFITWRLGRSFSGECCWGPRHFVNAGRVWATTLRPNPP